VVKISIQLSITPCILFYLHKKIEHEHINFPCSYLQFSKVSFIISIKHWIYYIVTSILYLSVPHFLTIHSWNLQSLTTYSAFPFEIKIKKEKFQADKAFPCSFLYAIPLNFHGFSDSHFSPDKPSFKHLFYFQLQGPCLLHENPALLYFEPPTRNIRCSILFLVQ
jgi:hypothetical protein